MFNSGFSEIYEERNIVQQHEWGIALKPIHARLNAIVLVAFGSGLIRVQFIGRPEIRQNESELISERHVVGDEEFR